MASFVRRPLALAPVLLGCAALVGCGTTVRHVTTTITRPAAQSSSATTTAASSTATATASATSSTTTAAATTAAASGLAGRSPRQVITLAARALRGTGGYAMRADLLQSGARTVISLTADSVHRYEATLTTGGRTFEVISLPGAAYLRGNLAFWRHEGATGSASRLAGHWLHVPRTGARSITRTLGTLTPGTLARCLTEDHGTLSLAGRRTVAGRSALVVRDAGNAPGATPSTIAVAASGTPFPLLYDATGATRRGGRVDVCNDGRGDGATGTIALSQFGDTPTVQAPAAAGTFGGSAT